jgi:hypothetical protein
VGLLYCVACDSKLKHELHFFLGPLVDTRLAQLLSSCQNSGIFLKVQGDIVSQSIFTENPENIKGIVSRDFVVCFLVSFDRSYISTHQERVLLLLKVRFRIEFFDFHVRP